MKFFGKIINALKKTKNSISSKIDSIFHKEIDEEFFENLESILISADIGVATCEEIIDELKVIIKKTKSKTCDEVKMLLRNIIKEKINFEKKEETYPLVSIIVGVNGVGKTTSIGKLANYYKNLNQKVVLVAGDTFRAAASEQLSEWADRSKIKIIKQGEGADPSSVVFDGLSYAKSKKADVVLIDTAGRLHNKVNLMEELAKIERVVSKNYSEANVLKLLVIDATTGQNGVIQAKEFNKMVNLDGIILSKLDGTSKGGIVISIYNELKIPVYFVGVGEKIDDIIPFDADEFAQSII